MKYLLLLLLATLPADAAMRRGPGSAVIVNSGPATASSVLSKTPSEIGNVWAHFDAAIDVLDTTGGSISNGEEIGSWGDQSANGYDIDDDNSTAPPTYIASDSNFGGKPSVSFNDADQECLKKPSTVTTVNQPFTLAIVINYEDINGMRNQAASSLILGTTTIHNSNTAPAKFGMRANSQVDFGVEKTVYGTPDVIFYVFNGSGSVGYINGVKYSASGSPGALGMNYVSIGGDNCAASYIDGEVAELVVFDKQITDDEAVSLYIHYQNKFGL